MSPPAAPLGTDTDRLPNFRISSGLSHLLTSPKLTILNLSGNKIKDFNELKALASLEKLEILDLFNNEVTIADNYRNSVFRLIPSLKFLDGFDKDDNEAPSDDEEDVNGNDDEDDEGELRHFLLCRSVRFHTNFVSWLAFDVWVKSSGCLLREWN